MPGLRRAVILLPWSRLRLLLFSSLRYPTHPSTIFRKKNVPEKSPKSFRGITISSVLTAIVITILIPVQLSVNNAADQCSSTDNIRHPYSRVAHSKQGRVSVSRRRIWVLSHHGLIAKQLQKPSYENVTVPLVKVIEEKDEEPGRRKMM